MSYYESWNEFVNEVLGRTGKAGTYLQAIFAAGGMALLFIVLSMLGFGPFMFVTWLLAFLITPPGWIVAAVFGAAAATVLKYLFSQRAKLQPILKRLFDARPHYEKIVQKFPDPTSPERRQAIDALLQWVMTGEPE